MTAEFRTEPTAVIDRRYSGPALADSLNVDSAYSSPTQPANSMKPKRSGVWKFRRPGEDQAVSSRSTDGGRSMRQKLARQLAPGGGGSAMRLRKGMANSAHQPVAVRRTAVRRPSQRQAKSFM